eukprot:13062347-Ditylum_brightwellii.AAC.1
MDIRNIFIRHGRKCPTLHIKLFTTHTNPDENALSWDTDGVPFVIDNSATGTYMKWMGQRSAHVAPNLTSFEIM